MLALRLRKENRMKLKDKVAAAVKESGLNVVVMVHDDGVEVFPASPLGVFGGGASSRLYAIGRQDYTEGQALRELLADVQNGSLAAEYEEITAEQAEADGLDFVTESIESGTTIPEWLRGEIIYRKGT
jgi:hypothetical protein